MSVRDEMEVEIERLREENALLLLDKPSEIQGLYAAIGELQRGQEDHEALRELLAKLMDPRKHWAVGIYTRAIELLDGS